MTGSVRRMESWLSGRNLKALLRAVTFLLVVCLPLGGLAAPALSAAQSVSASDREALDRLVAEAAAKGLPAAPLTNKIQEGFAKGADPRRIELVVRQMAINLETADRLVREIEPTSAGAGREASVTLLAESIGSGVTADEVRELRKTAQVSGKPPLTSEAVASAAKGLSFIKDARLPVADGAAVIAEAMKQGFPSREILDLGREVKRREADYRAGRASLRELRDAIARGDRPDQLFRDSRSDAAERPAATRPETQVDRPAARPETPQRPEQPVRPERPSTGRDR
jgi:hypothetical protein